MNLYEFEHQLSDEIVARYKKEREIYNGEIKYLKQIIDNPSSQHKLEDLIAKREQIKKAITFLQKRKDPVFYYSNQTNYRIIGSGDEYFKIHRKFEKARKIDLLLYTSIVNLKVNDQVYGKSLIGRHRHHKLISKYRRLKKKNGKIQGKQRKIILNQVEKVGKRDYGFVDNNFNNHQRKPSIISRLKSIKRATIVGYNEFKSTVNSNNPVYIKNNHY